MQRSTTYLEREMKATKVVAKAADGRMADAIALKADESFSVRSQTIADFQAPTTKFNGDPSCRQKIVEKLPRATITARDGKSL